MLRFGRSTSTSLGSRAAPSRPRRRRCASARGRFAELAVALALAGCTTEWTLGTAPGDPPAQPLGAAQAQGAWATDGHALYRLDVASGAFSAPTSFAGCDLTVVEIAQDDEGAMVAAGYEPDGRAALYSVQPATGACSVVSRFSTDAQWSVAFLGTRLVGDGSSGFVRLSTTDGARTVIAPASMTRTEGCDIVRRADGSTLSSLVVDGASAAPSNVLEQLDADTGRVLRTFAVPARVVLEGLAESDGVLYGFAADGRVYRVDLGDDAALSPVATRDGPARFTGAATMTAAPPR